MINANPEEQIGLVVNARGNTSIDQWSKGAKDGFYAQTMVAIDGIPKESISGIVWIQGFNNARDTEYLTKLAKLIADLRADIGQPHLPVVIGQVPIYDPKYPINALIADAPNHIEYLAVATNEGTQAFDGFHYDRASVSLMGERLAAAFLT